MSIKYLGDNQLNQIQNNPNDTPWAKLIAQSEMLERSKMRQPQGQYPQGTVASAIQQQLLNDQMQQANQVQGLDAEKARILAQLINSGQLQGMAGGGLTPSMSNQQLAPMLGASPIKPQVAQTQLAPTKEAIDQKPHHDIFQRLLDNSIVGAVQGKGSLNDTLQLYADMWTGKALKGLADGGEVRRFTEGGTLFEQLQRLKTQMAGASQGWTPEAAANYKSAYTPSMKESMSRRGLTPAQGAPSFEDIARAQARLRAQTGLDISNPETIRVPPYQERVTIPEGAAPTGLQTSAPRGFGAAPSMGPIPEYIPAEQPTIAGMLPKEHKVFEGASFEHPTSTPRADAAYAQAEYAERAANRGYRPMSKEAADLTAQEAARDAKWAQVERLAKEGPIGPGRPMALGSAFVPDSALVQQLSMPGITGYNYTHPELRSKLQSLFGMGQAAPTTSTEQPTVPTEQPAAPASQPTAAPTAQTQAVTKQPVTRDNAKQIAQVHGYEKQDSELLNKAQQLGALAQTEAAVTQTAGDNIVDMLHKRLKDADVDYMELAKRISENEKDLAQERKDGTLTAVLTGVGAALSRAGTLEQKGDRVFTPGIGQILGAGILGGIESSEATDKKYRTGIEKNLEALNALQGLKRATANDLMDAYAAERQNAALAQHYSNLDVNAAQKLEHEIAQMDAQTGMYKERAGAYNRAGTGTTGSSLADERLTTAQYGKLISDARAELTRLSKEEGKMRGDPEYDDLLNEIALYRSKMAGLTPAGNAGAATRSTTAATLPGFNLLSSRPAK